MKGGPHVVFLCKRSCNAAQSATTNTPPMMVLTLLMNDRMEQTARNALYCSKEIELANCSPV